MVQVGSIGLLRALDRFNVERQIDFSTFATPNIIGEIKHYFRDKKNLVKVPRKLVELHSKVKRFIREYHSHGKSPAVSVIAEALEESEEKILECLEANKSSSVLSLDTPYKSQSHRDTGSSYLLETLGLEHDEDFYLSKITLFDALETLNTREKRIIYLRFYDGLSQTEIAETLNLSQMHISRLLGKTLIKLQKALVK